MDIITNKIPLNERENIPHHLIDFLEPHQEYRVTDFTKDALQIVSIIILLYSFFFKFLNYYDLHHIHHIIIQDR